MILLFECAKGFHPLGDKIVYKILYTESGRPTSLY